MKTSFFGWAMGIVAVSALVACGDDTTDGTGGAGGEGQGGATTATTTTTSSTGGEGGSTTTTTTTSSTGGEGGSGGTGGGSNCIEITAEDLTNASQQGVGFLTFGVSPSLGEEDLPDNGQIEIYDDGGETFNGATPGTYDLAEEDNYATCSRCVRVFEDSGEEGPARQYFQSGGTFELAEEGNDIVNGIGTVTLSDVTLVEVEIDPETFESTPVDGGTCLHIASIEYVGEAPVIPEEWTCSPGFYDAADGCDCDCGAPDPDCDLPEQDLYGCEEGQTCSAAGECEGIPTAWTCEDAVYDSGGECNCDCGTGDPDCENDLAVIVGCELGEVCSLAGECTAPETLCSDLTDNDGDNLFDCDDPSTCQGTPACLPGLTPVGGTCDANTDCAASDADPFCLSEEAFDFNGGACAEWCDLADDDCPAGNVCVSFGVERGVCVPSCDDATDCRDDASCLGDPGICLPDPPACVADAPDLGATVDGDTTDGASGPAASCAGSIFGPPGLGEVYDFTATANGTYTFTLESESDQGVSIRTACADVSTELGCVDAEVGGTDEVLEVDLVAGTTYTVLVQAYATGEEGPYTLTVDAP